MDQEEARVEHPPDAGGGQRRAFVVVCWREALSCSWMCGRKLLMHEALRWGAMLYCYAMRCLLCYALLAMRCSSLRCIQVYVIRYSFR